MDNGHSAPTNSTQPFFTIGQGNNDPDINTFEAEDNLNTSDNPSEWVGPSQGRNLNTIGDRAIESYKQDNEVIHNQELGEVIDMAMPPNIGASKHAASNNVDTLRHTEDGIGAKKRENGNDIIRDTQKDVVEFNTGKISPAEVISRLQEESNAYIQTEFGRELGK